MHQCNLTRMLGVIKTVKHLHAILLLFYLGREKISHEDNM